MNKSKQHANELTKQYKQTPNLAPGFWISQAMW
jgi:hypothetical protein